MSDERGFTMVELLAAMFVGLIVIGAGAFAFTRNDDSSLATQRQSQLVAALQSRVELVHQVSTQYGFDALSLSSTPASGADVTLPQSPTDANDFLTSSVSPCTRTAGTMLIEKNYNLTTEGSVDGTNCYAETLQVDATNGRIAPVTFYDITTGTDYTSAASVPTGDEYATVHTYITLTTPGTAAVAPTCPAGAAAGSTTADARRVVVAAQLHTAAGNSNLGAVLPQYTTTLLARPVPSNQCQSASGLRIGFNIG